MANVARPIGELDLYLFGEGTHRRLWELLGPQPLRVDVDGRAAGVRFAVWAPNARSVAVVGDWNGWTPEPLGSIETDVPTGIWTVVASAARSGHRYEFDIETSDGWTVRKADPMARQTERPPHDASVVPAFVDHPWGDDAWMAARGGVRAGTSPMRIYEVHLGSWRHGVDTWDSLSVELADHIAGLGFTHVELMGVAEHPFGGSVGSEVSGYYAPTARFGEPDGVRRLVDTFHRRGLGVIVDWVPAHFPRDEWSLGRFDGTSLSEHPDPRRGEHPDRGTYVVDYSRNEVRNFLVANALYWLDEFHVDGLRVGAVSSMLAPDVSRRPGEWSPNREGGREDLEALAFVKELTAVIGEEFPDALVISEESTAWPGVTRSRDDGGLGFSHTWNLGWRHDTLGYLALDHAQRCHHHRAMTSALLDSHVEQFVLPLSHDEVVHGRGSLLSKLSGDDEERFAALRTLFAWQWALPGAPLLFMGSELAPWEEWNHEAGLAWHLLDAAAHRGVRDLVAQLNVLADEWPALWRRDADPGGFQWLDADDADHSSYAFVRWDLDAAAAVVGIANFTPVPRSGYRVGLPWAGDWDVVLDTDAVTWWGSGHGGDRRPVTSSDEPWQGCSWSGVLDIGPMSMVWLAARSLR